MARDACVSERDAVMRAATIAGVRESFVSAGGRHQMEAAKHHRTSNEQVGAALLVRLPARTEFSGLSSADQ